LASSAAELVGTPIVDYDLWLDERYFVRRLLS